VLAATFFSLNLFLAFFCVHFGFSSFALVAGLLHELPTLLVFCAQPLAAYFCMLPECCELWLVFHLRMPSQKQTAIPPQPISLDFITSNCILPVMFHLVTL